MENKNEFKKIIKMLNQLQKNDKYFEQRLNLHYKFLVSMREAL